MKYDKLVRFNLKMGFLHAVQALLVLLISNDFSRSLSIEYFSYNETTESLDVLSRNIVNIHIASFVALFFALSAAAHLLLATVGKDWYVRNLKKGINKARWYEYSVSASIMIVLIAMLSGIFNVVALLGLFALTAVMNLMGLVMEVHNQTTKKTNWLSYNIGVFAGIVPWLAIGLAFWASESSGSGSIPTFVYFIFGSLFLFFNSFAVNMVLQYKKIGRWSDYLYGERVYIILSLVAKSALAWQIYAGTLQP
jgi:hypothetical protein